ncbi:MAG TPA: sensor histidine kinase [Actinoplanes sp.]|nr:sensor histidine kinase [Actinoplanes sp.]
MSGVVTAETTRRWRATFESSVRWLPHAVLTASLVLVVVSAGADLPRAPLPVTLSAVAATAAWLFWFVNWRRRTSPLFFLGLLALIALLIACSPLFGFFVWSAYLFTADALPGRWALVGAAAVGAFVATTQVGGYPALADTDAWPIFGLVLLFNVAIGTLMTFLAMVSDAQAERRKQMVRQLEEANAKLAAAMRENAGLHAQLLVQAREAGVLDERQRMAGEIHDILAQGLTGIVTQLEAADQAAGRPAAQRRHLDQARQLARDSLTEARRSVQALSPQPLAEAALPQALAEVVGGWSGITGVPARLITTGTAQPLLPEIETTLLRTAQEALANVARHARASRVALTLSYMEDLVSLDVRDDGAGFDPAAPRTAGAGGGFGLAAMRERLHRIAGTLEVESEPGAGTAVSASAPAITLREAAA